MEFGLALSVVGFVELWLGANLLTSLLGLFTELSYLLVYTPLKQRSPHSTTIGAIPGAMPPLIGYAAACGTLTWGAWALYAILFLWQFPHFYAIAWMYRDDYAQAGIRMLPVVEPSNESTARRMLLFSLVLVPISLLPKYLDMAGNFYLVGALALGLYFLLLLRSRDGRPHGRACAPGAARERGLSSVALWPPGVGRFPLLALLLLAGCSAKPPLPSYGVVPDFTLTDQNGAAFSSAALDKRVWIADFIFTNCPGPCPRMSSQMHQVQTALASDDGVRFVSFTVDPARDTPMVLTAYSKHFEADPAKWFFLTGPTDAR